jgi:hypothetical protein
MPKKPISLILLILLILVGAAQAQVSITYSSKGKQHFTMTIPDDWRVNVGSETDPSQLPEEKKTPSRLISLMPNDGMPLWFGIWVPEYLEKIKYAEEYMVSLGLDLLTDVVTTKRRFDTLNSMETYYISGTGKKEGETMDFHAAFFQLSQESVGIAIYIGPHETTNLHGDGLVQMLHSLKPVMQ